MKILAISEVLLIFTLSALTQSDTGWTSISTGKGDFVISLPSNFIVNNSGKEVTILASRMETSFKVSIDESANGRERLKLSQRFNTKDEEWKISRYKVGNFDMETETFEKNNYHLNLKIASSSAFYTISISAKSNRDKALEAFLMSVLLDQALGKIHCITPED